MSNVAGSRSSTVVAASMMDLLDSTSRRSPARSIRTDLGGSLADLQWMTAAYTLAMAVMLLTGGRLGDIYGRRACCWSASPRSRSRPSPSRPRPRSAS